LAITASADFPSAAMRQAKDGFAGFAVFGSGAALRSTGAAAPAGAGLQLSSEDNTFL